MVYLKKTLKFLISYLIYFILNLIYPILKIRFGRIYASRIGHLCYNVDNYISKVKDKKNIITFFCYDEPVSNKFIFDLFKKKKNIFFTNKIRFLYYIIKNINSNSRLLVAFFDEMHPRISYTSASKRNLPKIRNYNLLNDFLKENHDFEIKKTPKISRLRRATIGSIIECAESPIGTLSEFTVSLKTRQLNMQFAIYINSPYI